MWTRLTGRWSHEGESDENFYSQATREALLADDELKSAEDGFMQGYEKGFPENVNEHEDDDDAEWSTGRAFEEVV